MPTIPNKQRVSVTVTAPGNDTTDVVVPNSQHYTKFAISIPSVAPNCTISVVAAIPGTNADINNGAVVDETALPIVRQGISSGNASEILFDLAESQTNIFDTLVPFPGGIALRFVNPNGGATASMSIGVMMYDSAFSARL